MTNTINNAAANAIIFSHASAFALQQVALANNVQHANATCMHINVYNDDSIANNVQFTYEQIDYGTATYEQRTEHDTHSTSCEDAFELLVYNKYGSIMREDVGGFTKYFTDEKQVAFYDYENYGGHIA